MAQIFFVWYWKFKFIHLTRQLVGLKFLFLTTLCGPMGLKYYSMILFIRFSYFQVWAFVNTALNLRTHKKCELVWASEEVYCAITLVNNIVKNCIYYSFSTEIWRKWNELGRMHKEDGIYILGNKIEALSCAYYCLVKTQKTLVKRQLAHWNNIYFATSKVFFLHLL